MVIVGRIDAERTNVHEAGNPLWQRSEQSPRSVDVRVAVVLDRTPVADLRRGMDNVCGIDDGRPQTRLVRPVDRDRRDSDRIQFACVTRLANDRRDRPARCRGKATDFEPDQPGRTGHAEPMRTGRGGGERLGKVGHA